MLIFQYKQGNPLFTPVATALAPRVWYRLDESSTATPPQDSSGNGYHGVAWYNNPTLQTKSLIPSEPDDYSFQAGNTTSGPLGEGSSNAAAWNVGNSFSVAMVYERWDTSKTGSVMIRRDGTQQNHRQWSFGFNNTTGLGFSVAQSNTWYSVNEGVPFGTDTNPHIAVGVHDFDNSRFEVWIDGTQRGSGTARSAVQQPTSGSRVGIGRGIGWTNSTCGCYISELLYFDKALTTSEIENLSAAW